MAPVVVVRFHQMPMVIAGKLPAMASENAQPTMARMSDGLVEASAAEVAATYSSRMRATVKRLVTSFIPNQKGAITMRRNEAKAQHPPAQLDPVRSQGLA